MSELDDLFIRMLLGDNRKSSENNQLILERFSKYRADLKLLPSLFEKWKKRIEFQYGYTPQDSYFYSSEEWKIERESVLRNHSNTCSTFRSGFYRRTQT